MKNCRLTILAGLAITFLAGQLALAADILDHVPANSMFVLKVRNLKQTSDKIAEFSQALGLNEFNPDFADPLGAMQRESKITQGIDSAGDFALFMIDPKATNLPEDKSVQALIPVTDYKAFLGNFQDAKTEGDITEGTTPDGEHIFVASRGSYAAVSPSKEVLALKSEGIKIDGISGRELQTKDAILYVNFDIVKREILPKMQEGREKFVEDFVQGFMRSSTADEKTAKMVKVIAGRLVDGAQQFVTDTKAVTWGVTITKVGLNSTMLAEFVPDSHVAQIVGRIKNSDASMVAGLPEAKYLFFGGSAIDSAAASKTVDELSAPIVADLAQFGDDAKPILQWVDAVKILAGATTGNTFAMVAPEGQFGRSALTQMVAIYRGDAAKLKTAQQQLFQAQPAVMKLFGTDLDGKIASTYTSNAKTIDGVQLDALAMKFSGQPKTQIEQEAIQRMTFMYGPNGFSGYSGVANDKALVATQGLSDDALATMVTAAKNGTDVLGKKANIKVVDAELPQTRAVAVYVPLDTIATTILGYARQFGFAVPVQLPPDLPPIGITASSDGNAIRGDMHVPRQLVQSLVQAGLQAYSQMKGGPGGGGGGGGPDGPDGPGGL